ncbi:unnamed protein product, partial [Scytosiphon promiscuus]
GLECGCLLVLLSAAARRQSGRSDEELFGKLRPCSSCLTRQRRRLTRTKDKASCNQAGTRGFLARTPACAGSTVAAGMCSDIDTRENRVRDTFNKCWRWSPLNQSSEMRLSHQTPQIVNPGRREGA